MHSPPRDEPNEGLTDEEEAEIQRQTAEDPDTWEWTEEDFARARPFKEVHPELYELWLKPRIEAEARAMVRETIEASGWYLDLRHPARAERIKQDVDRMWRMMAEAARRRLEEDQP